MLFAGILQSVPRALEAFFDVTQRFLRLALNLFFQAFCYLTSISNQFTGPLLRHQCRQEARSSLKKKVLHESPLRLYGLSTPQIVRWAIAQTTIRGETMIPTASGSCSNEISMAKPLGASRAAMKE